MKSKAIIVSGYFNPLHKGHLELFEKAKSAGDELWVIVNSDLQRALKGSKEFMDENERLIIVSAIKHVDKALISIDKDKTQQATLAYLADSYNKDFDLFFANGGDQNNESIPEVPICREKGIEFIEGLGDKIQSSSWLLKNKMQVKNVCCIGAGYVGGPTMAVIALKCPHINVTVVDANPEKIKAWNGPLENLPVYEPGLSDVVKEARGRNLFFSDDIAGNIEKSEMIFVAVNTPTKTEGEGAGMAADLRYIEACARDIAKYSKSHKIVVEKSTLPVRTAEKIKEILEENSNGIHFEILSNPEFLAEGTAIQDLFKSDRVLIGGDEMESGQKAIKVLWTFMPTGFQKKKY